MDAKSSIQRATLAAILLLAGAGGAAFGDDTSAGVTVLRGTPPPVPPQQAQPQIQVKSPPTRRCPEGYFYSVLLGYCYPYRNPASAR